MILPQIALLLLLNEEGGSPLGHPHSPFVRKEVLYVPFANDHAPDKGFL